MKVIELLQQITLEGFTYLPGKYEVVEGNDFGPGQITEKRAQKLIDDYPGEVVGVYEVKVKNGPKIEAVTVKPFDTKSLEGKAQDVPFDVLQGKQAGEVQTRELDPTKAKTKRSKRG